MWTQVWVMSSVNKENFDMWPQVQVLWSSQHGTCGCVNPGQGSGRWDHPWDWTCDPRCRVWGRFTLATVDITPRSGSWRTFTLQNVDMWSHVHGVQSYSPGRLWPCDTWYSVWRGVSAWRLWTCTPCAWMWAAVTLETVHVWHSFSIWDVCHPGYGGPLTSGTGSWGCGHPGDCVHVTAGTGSEWWAYPMDCGHVTPRVGIGGGLCRDCGCLTLGAWSGKRSP